MTDAARRRHHVSHDLAVMRAVSTSKPMQPNITNSIPNYNFSCPKPTHAEQAVALARLTNPGPSACAHHRVGAIISAYFLNDWLVAMSGERMHAGIYHEVSGVCTHPDFQGKGLHDAS